MRGMRMTMREFKWMGAVAMVLGFISLGSVAEGQVRQNPREQLQQYC